MSVRRVYEASRALSRTQREMCAAIIVDLVECIEEGEPIGWARHFGTDEALLQRIRDIRQKVTGAHTPLVWNGAPNSALPTKEAP